ncbi:SGNH/GDSL hydrolase family protein [Hymenobacter persicinus]|uniref:G-D-S-L family lipolytic protein n=1 Tax=Hymenobacter persicinus TaxID=2025506 RepID=A0A4Q5LCI8_9BACT|nr:SGNH/GDSL hydrolase family protein [Hymenobacter persicinus]RYU80140.1 hypothetical protein EWM57_09365 [Hymenobacter persicinus]
MNTTFIFRKTAPFLALLGLSLSACQPDLENDNKPSAGTADFTTYIAVGNSLTAGYQDDGLYLQGQQNSYPALLAQQFKAVGGGEFAQPLFSPGESNGTGYLQLTGFTNPPAPATPSPILTRVTTSLATGRGLGLDGKTTLLTRYTGTDNQNLGVPGIRVADITTPGYGLNNPQGFNQYFERLLPANSTTSYLAYVQERVTTLKPTFFTNWLGNNDVLGYATTGGVTPLSTVADFTAKYNQMVDVLTANGAKGVVATIPNVTNVPLFTTVPTAAVIAQINATPIPAALVPVLLAQLAPLGVTTLPAGTRFGLYIKTNNTGSAREATAADLLLLPASSYINTPSATSPFPNGIGIVIPGASAALAGALAASANALPNVMVLDAAEISSVTTRTNELNTVITAAAARKGLAVFNANTFFSQVASNGFITNNVSNNASFISGNLFSLDGVHPTPRGYAVVANEMIKAINSTYESRVPQLNPNDYRGVRFPQ